jgi:apolipoprotein N-acyltransferase
MAHYGERGKDLVLLTLGAGLYTLAAPPYEWASTAWIALTPLYLVLRDKTPRAAFLIGCLFGLLFGVGLTYWSYFAITAYFHFSFPLNLLCTLFVYGLFLCPYTGLAALFSCQLIRSRSPCYCRIGVPALWVAGEFARSSLFAGFSWELLGHTQYRYLTLIQITDVTGVYGLSFLMALSGYLIAELVAACAVLYSSPPPLRSMTRMPWAALSCFLLSLMVVMAYGTVRRLHYVADYLQQQQSVTISLIPGKGSDGRQWQQTSSTRTLLQYASTTRQELGSGQPDLVMWPEFAVGFYLDHEPLLRLQLGQLLEGIHAPLLLGAPRMERTETGPHYFNSAYLLAADGRLVEVYDKIRLLPFAEYRPLALPALLQHSPESPSEFTAGTHATLFPLRQGPFGVMICYEATYPQLARRLVQAGAAFLVNLSNETWLSAGGNVAALQHFSMAVFRAVENKRFLARVATAGISGFVDPTGHPYGFSALGEQGTRGRIAPLHTHTVYAQYGEWFAWACILVACAVFLPLDRLPLVVREP